MFSLYFIDVASLASMLIDCNGQQQQKVPDYCTLNYSRLSAEFQRYS